MTKQHVCMIQYGGLASLWKWMNYYIKFSLLVPIKYFQIIFE